MSNPRKQFFKEQLNTVAISLTIITLIGFVLSAAINRLQELIVPWMTEHFPWVFEIALASFALTNLLLQIGKISLIAIFPTSLVFLLFRRLEDLELTD